MKLRSLPSSLKDWRGKRVLVRVDWNVPLLGEAAAEDQLRIARSLPLLKRLQEAEATIVVLTHLGRPSSTKDKHLSTEYLIPILKKHGIRATWHDAALDDAKDREWLLAVLTSAKSGTIHLLENVRFFTGEETNQVTFAKGLAGLGEVFIQDAFAVSHRAHASVVGVAKYLETYAGPALEEEVQQLMRYRDKLGKRGRVLAFFGGKKLSSKKEVITAFLPRASKVFIGGAMALAAEVARRRSVGKSFVEEGQGAFAKKLLASKNVVLPKDYVVANELSLEAKTRISDGGDIRANEYIVDVGPRTLMMWAQAIREADRCVWNGPMGIVEFDAFGAGSRGLARFLGCIPGKRHTLVGGGDTIPVLASAGVMNRLSFVSTGGGAMLEFLDRGEALPGLRVLFEKT